MKLIIFHQLIFPQRKKYVLNLIELLTFNSIPNIDTNCNKIYIGTKTIVLPTGSYEITDINNYIQTQLESKDISFSLTANNNTLKSVITNNHPVDFQPEDSIAKLLGFSHCLLDAEKTHTSSVPVKILKFNVLRVECNITGGAYINNKKVHTIHEFFPAVPPGFKIIEIPSKVIYQPLHCKKINCQIWQNLAFFAKFGIRNCQIWQILPNLAKNAKFGKPRCQIWQNLPNLAFFAKLGIRNCQTWQTQVPNLVKFGIFCQTWHPELPNLANPGAKIWQKCQNCKFYRI